MHQPTTNPTTNQPNGQAEQIERTTNQEVLTSEVQMGIAWRIIPVDVGG